FEISDVTNIFVGSGFSIFENNIAKGAVVRAIPAPKAAAQSRSFFDRMNDWARSEGAPGLGYIIFDGGGESKGPIAKFFDAERLERLKKVTGTEPNDAVFFVCGDKTEASKLAGQVRVKLGEDLDLIE